MVMKKYHFLFVSLIILIIIVISCEIDHGLYPINYLIKGTIFFVMGDPPDSTDRIEVFALKEFPPKDPQNFLYLGQSGPIVYDNEERNVEYEIKVSPTSYQLVVLLWKQKNHDLNLTGILGIYTGKDGASFSGTVEVSKEIPVVENVNIYANWEKVNKDGFISGDISYEGKWPEDTSILLLAIYNVKPNPENEGTYFSFENFDYTQPLFTVSSSYRLAVRSSIYNYIVLFWVGKNVSKLTDLVEIGVYESPNYPGEPGTVDLSAGGEAENIDIHVDFNKIEFPKK
jgi:hypothetical protein